MWKVCGVVENLGFKFSLVSRVITIVLHRTKLKSPYEISNVGIAFGYLRTGRGFCNSGNNYRSQHTQPAVDSATLGITIEASTPRINTTSSISTRVKPLLVFIFSTFKPFDFGNQDYPLV
jgi:hypothetical protein